VLIGAAGASFGPILPSFRSTFGLSAAIGGLLLSGHYTGAVIGILSPNVLRGRMRSTRALAIGGTTVFAAGCLVIGVSPAPWTALLGAVIEGAGWGALVICFNSLFAAGFGERSPAMLTLLNATFGVGSIAGPAAVGLLFGGHFRPPFIAAALLAVLALTLTPALPGAAIAAPDDAAPGLRIHGYAPALALFVVLFFLLGGTEGGVSAWMATNLVATGMSVTRAATITSLFWVLYTATRLVIAPVTLLVPPRWIVTACLAFLAVLMLLAHAAVLTAPAYVLAGAAIAPTFPLSLVWAGKALAISDRVMSFVVAGDLFGGILLSAGAGRLVTAAGATALPFAFTGVAGVSCVLALLLAGQTARIESV
jgi:MFS transporter, FHS family, glucose/mannose:H+ symporter